MASTRPSKAAWVAAIRASYAAWPERASTIPGGTRATSSRQGFQHGSVCLSMFFEVLAASGLGTSRMSNFSPTNFSARLSTPGCPTASSRQVSRISGDTAARTMVSGPMPATSPSVKATQGSSTLSIKKYRSAHNFGGFNKKGWAGVRGRQGSAWRGNPTNLSQWIPIGWAVRGANRHIRQNPIPPEC